MIVAPIPSRESARLDALHRSRILDTPAEPAFDELARLAAYVCRTPMAVISLVDATRQWFKSVVGLPYTESPRSTAFCAHTILGTDLFIVEEADADERFADHPWVVEPPAIRLYAGVPLITLDGYAIGSLAVMDVSPRTLCPEQRACLRIIANQVMAQLELRRSARPDIRRNETEDPVLCGECPTQNTADALVRESELKFRSIFEQAPVGIATIDSITGRFRRVNSSYCRIMGYTEEEMRSRTFLDITHPDDLQADLDRMTQLLDGDIATFEMEKRYFRKNGDTIWVHLTCVPLW